MKKFLLALVLMMPVIAQAEITRDNISISDYDLTLSGVEKVGSLSAKDIYNAVLAWMSHEYDHPQDFIKKNSFEAIVLNGRLGAQINGDKCINCSLVFRFKDGRYKWEVMDCIYLEDNLGLIMGRSDRPVMALPRYNRPSRFSDIISDFSPMVDSFRKFISEYQPGVAPIPENLSADW